MNPKLRFRTTYAYILSSMLLTFFLPLLAITVADGAKTQVYVVSTLYKRHESFPGYNLEALRKTILAIKPEVFVLDVTPDELKTEKVWPGKVEYPSVIFPIMKEQKIPAYASEPKEPLFSELTKPADRAYQEAEQKNPDGYQAMEKHKQATYDALRTIWKSPADVNSALTDKILEGRRVLEEEIVGEAAKSVQRNWNEHHVERILEAVKENPGKRIVVFIGVENRYAVNRLLKHHSQIELVEMESWLHDNYPKS